MPKKCQNKVIVILGPTASGKTKLAVKLANFFNGEIISADSRQIYKGLNIGTGKDLDEYGKTPYHLIDITTPDKQFSLAKFQKICSQAIDKIIKKGKTPILVGGAGLYLESILNNYQIPKVKPNKHLRKKLEKLSIEELTKLIKKRNLKQVNIKNKRRLIRAIEISNTQSNSQAASNCEFLILGITRDKPKLDELINKRTDEMIKLGLVNETKKLIKKYPKSTVPLQTIGYKEIIDHLNHKTDLDQTIKLIKLHTRQFAKRQMTWFHGMNKRNPKNNIHWLKSYAEAKKLIKSFINS